MSPTLRLLLAVLQAAVLVALAGCGQAPTPSVLLEPRSLSGLWAFQPGDDPAWAAPEFDDRAWPRVQVPGSWRRQGFDELRGVAWYRLRVSSLWPPEEMLGVTLGKIDSAYELYVGGRLLGGVGAVPPNPRIEYDRHRTYSIPLAARQSDGSVVLALRIWRDPQEISSAAGPVEGPFEVGPLIRLIEREKLAEAQQLALLLLFMLVAVYHFTLRIQLGSGADYVWFGVLALLAAVYGFLRTQWKYALLDDFLVLKKIEHAILWLIPATIVQFLWIFFRQTCPRWLRVTQIVLLVGALTVAVTPGLVVPLALLPVLQLSVVPFLVASLALVIRQLVSGDREARLVAIAMAVLGVTIVHDALVDRNYLVNPRVAIYGFAFLVVGMSVTLGGRFQRALRDRDTVMRELESRVAARTRELNEAYREMEELALRDSLTQVLSRRAILDRAASELARARRYGAPFAIALIDVDRFKDVNDTWGHGAGDDVLRQVARRLVHAVRASDDVGRWGGDEFMVLMPGTDRREAAVAGERFRNLVAARSLTITKDTVQTITVSIGLMATDSIGEQLLDLDALMRHADRALYRAKANGRNAACVAEVADISG